MNDKYTIIAIMGQAGSGKDSFMKAIVTGGYFHNAKPIVSCTTRPIREYEIDGVNYHYLTNDEFADQIVNGDMLEAAVFNNWCYGTSVKNLDKDAINIGVFNPTGIEILRDNITINLIVIYIIADDKVRLLRQLNREEHPDCIEIVRRFGTDKADFKESRINEIKPDFVVENNGELDIDTIARRFVMKYYNILGKMI